METARRLPVRLANVELTGDYEGWKFTARTNLPLRIINEITSGDLNRSVAGLALAITEWNFVDEKGDLLKSPPDTAAMQELPLDLLGEVASKFVEKLGEKLPKT